MEAYVAKIASEQGLNEDVVKGIFSKVMKVIKDSAPAEVTDAIDKNVPQEGLTEGKPDMPCMPVLDFLKDLLKKIGAGDAVTAIEGGELAQVISKSGISPEQGGSIIQKMIDMFKEKCGTDTVDKLMESVPALKTVMEAGAPAA